MPNAKPKPAFKKLSHAVKAPPSAPAPSAEHSWYYEKKYETSEPAPTASLDQPAPLPPHSAFKEPPPAPAHSSFWRKLQALAIFLFPFVVWPGSLSPLEFSKQTYLAGIVGLTLLIVLIHSWKQGRLNLIPRHPVLLIGLAALVLAGISSARSGLASLSFFGYGGAEALSFASLGLLGLWTILIFHAGYLKREPLILKALLFSGSILSLLTILSLLGLNLYRFIPTQGFNPAGTTTTANLIGTVALLLAAGGWLKSQSKKSALLYLLAMLPPAVLLSGTGFRAPLLAAALGLGVLLLFNLRTINSPVRLTLLLLGTAAALVLAIWPFTAFLPTPLEIGPAHPETWAIAKATLADHPLLGSGPASFAVNYLRWRSLPILQTPFWNVSFDWGSSALLTFLTNLGWLGGGLLTLSLLSIILWYGFRLLRQKDRADSGALLAVGLAFLVGFALSPFLLTAQFFFATILGLMLGAFTHPFSIGARKQTPSVALTLTGALLLILALVLFIGQGRRLTAEVLAYQGLTRLPQNPAGAEQKLARAIRFDRWNDLYLRIFAEVQRSQLNQKLSAIPPDDPQEALQEIRALADGALRTTKRATELTPNNVANWAALGNIYLDISAITGGAPQAALAAFTRALELAPTDPSLLVSQSIARTLESRTAPEETKPTLEQEAVQALQRALEIRPTYSPAQLELARLFASSGKIEEALTAYRKAEALAPQDAALRFEVGALLLQKDRNDEARAELEAAVQLAPNFSNARWFLAQLLEEKGEVAGALAQIEKILELNPQNEQAKTRLEELKKKAPK